MSGPTNAQIASQVSTLISAWTTREEQYRAWLAGTADGGPNGDGRYELTNALGVTYLVLCPAALAHNVSGPAVAAQAALLAAEAARDGAISEATRAEAERVLAEAARAASVTARDQAQLARSGAQNAEANTLVHRQAAETARAGTAADLLGTIANREDAEYAAAWARNYMVDAKAAAEAAGNYDPSLYATRASGLTQIVGLQDALNARVLTSGFTWENLQGKPSTFVPTAHGHAWGEISEKPATFSPAPHTHPWSQVTDKPDLVTVAATHLGETGNGGLRTFNSTSEISNLPTGWTSMIAPGAQGAPDGGYGYFFKVGRRYVDGGYSALWISHGGGPDAYVGFASTSTENPKWTKLWTADTFSPSSKADALHSHDWAQITGKPDLMPKGGGTFNGWIAVPYLYLNPGSGDEGGEMLVQGSNGYRDITIDNYTGVLRIFSYQGGIPFFEFGPQGLKVDTVRVPRITSGTSGGSGGQHGDIHIVY